jgi:hypothetical protein
MASENEAAREAVADQQPPAAFTMPLPIKLAAVFAFWMKLVAIVASLRGVARLKVKERSNVGFARESKHNSGQTPQLLKLPTVFGVRQAKHPQWFRKACRACRRR